MTRSAADEPLRSGAGHRPIQLRDRLLAGAVVAWEQLGNRIEGHAQAEAAAREAGGDFEQRLITRAQALPIASSIAIALEQTSHALRWIVAIAVVFGVIAGAAAARVALGVPRDEPVNIYTVLGGLLGLQTLLLLAWIVIMLAGPRFASRTVGVATLGGAVVRLGQQLVLRLHRGTASHAAAVTATGNLLMRSPVGRWTISAISHAIWLAFNVGCLVLVIALLSTRQYTFAWETTILSERTYVPLTQAIAAGPHSVGFATPTAEQIRASQWRGQPWAVEQLAAADAASQAWSAFLVGAIVVYGLGPRLLLLGWCLGRRRAAAAAYRLHLDRPELLHLRSRLMPETRSIGIVDADDGRSVSASRIAHDGVIHPTRPPGPPAIVGVEITAPRGAMGWPPPVHEVRWLDLGFVDTRDDQHRVLRQLADNPSEPQSVVAVCALATTPDRGVGAFLGQLVAAVTNPVTLVLTGGQTMRQRGNGERLSRRIDDWRRLAGDVGIAPHRVIEIDLDHLTQASAAKLAAAVKGADEPTAATAGTGGRVDQAFELIASQVGIWADRDTAPSTAEQAELHRSIAQLYRDDVRLWPNWLQTPQAVSGSIGPDFAGRLKSSAQRVVEILPGRLRSSPKWLAAGAAAGALGCIAAATLLSPVAIGALPMWSTLGAGLAAVAQQFVAGWRADQSGDGAIGGSAPADVIRAAALFALLLELQGCDEMIITRILDRVIVDDDPIAQQIETAHDREGSVDATRRWLGQLRERLDLALAAEAIR